MILYWNDYCIQRSSLGELQITSDILATSTITVTPFETTYPVTTIAETSTYVVTYTPSVALATPTALTQSGFDYDDEWFALDIPFAITFYDQSNANLLVNVNGVSCRS